jgi:hypothetical protein
MNRLLVTLVILVVLLFVPAGRITWTRGWIFLLVFTLLMATSIAYFTRANSEMFAVRSRVHPGTKRWDKIVICLLFVAILAIPPVAGLDDGRFHLSSMSWWVVASGYLVQLAGWIGVAWAETVNRFFEPGVRHSDRARTSGDRYWAVRPHSASRLFRCGTPLCRHRIVAKLLVGIDSCGFCFALARTTNCLGRPNIAC